MNRVIRLFFFFFSLAYVFKPEGPLRHKGVSDVLQFVQHTPGLITGTGLVVVAVTVFSLSLSFVTFAFLAFFNFWLLI
jgi:hypothetical protein